MPTRNMALRILMLYTAEAALWDEQAYAAGWRQRSRVRLGVIDEGTSCLRGFHARDGRLLSLAWDGVNMTSIDGTDEV